MRSLGRPVGLRLLVGLGLLAWAGLAVAAGWGGITPGETTRREVEARYGRPTRERAITEDGRTGSEWTYVGERTPRGLERMVVSFGLAQPSGFAPELVRGLVLYPKPRVFTLEAITNGWGAPDAIGTDEQTGRPAFRYQAKGLLIILEKAGTWAEVLLFAPEPRPAKTPS